MSIIKTDFNTCTTGKRQDLWRFTPSFFVTKLFLNRNCSTRCLFQQLSVVLVRIQNFHHRNLFTTNSTAGDSILVPNPTQVYTDCSFHNSRSCKIRIHDHFDLFSNSGTDFVPIAASRITSTIPNSVIHPVVWSASTFQQFHSCFTSHKHKWTSTIPNSIINLRSEVQVLFNNLTIVSLPTNTSKLSHRFWT